MKVCRCGVKTSEPDGVCLVCKAGITQQRQELERLLQAAKKHRLSRSSRSKSLNRLSRLNSLKKGGRR